MAQLLQKAVHSRHRDNVGDKAQVKNQKRTILY